MFKNTIYLNKYLKYKNKYLFLKEQMGGSYDLNGGSVISETRPVASDKIYNFSNFYMVTISIRSRYERTYCVDDKVYIYDDTSTSKYVILPVYTSNVSDETSTYYFQIDGENYVLIAHLLDTLPITKDTKDTKYDTLYHSNSIKKLHKLNLFSITIYAKHNISYSYLNDTTEDIFYDLPSNSNTYTNPVDFFSNIKTSLIDLQTIRIELLTFLNTIIDSIKQDYVIPDSFKYLPCEIETEYNSEPNITNSLLKFINHHLFDMFYFYDTITKKYKLKQYNTLEVHEYIFIEQKDTDYNYLEDIISIDYWKDLSQDNKQLYVPHEMKCVIIYSTNNEINIRKIKEATKFSFPVDCFTVELHPTQYCLQAKKVEKNKKPDYFYFNHRNYISIYEYKRASVYVRSRCRPILSRRDTDRIIAYVYLPLWNAQLMLLKKLKLTSSEQSLLLPFFKDHYMTTHKIYTLYSEYSPDFDGIILSNDTIEKITLNTSTPSRISNDRYTIEEVEEEAVEAVEEVVK